MSEPVQDMLKTLRLPTLRQEYEGFIQEAREEEMEYEEFLSYILIHECEGRRRRRIERNLKKSRLPEEKTFETFDMGRMPKNIRLIVKELRTGEFLSRSENVLAFGATGTGKTHLLQALGRELIYNDHRVYFSTCQRLVEHLLNARRELQLEKELKRLGRFEAVIIDDIGYVQHSRDEMEVLFTLLAQRYERSSVMITSNLPFSDWEKIFKDPMTTAAAVDRVVHHSIILELNVPSYRFEEAKNNKKTQKKENLQ